MGGVEPHRPQVSSDVVRVETGRLLGAVHGDVVAFKGVPYAAPPIGELRWRPPQPAPAWRGLRPSDQYGAIPMQRLRSRDRGVGPPPASEDCLTLNLWAPVCEPRVSLPVMVWIHGGGYATGSGTAALYEGAHLARQGAVVVTVNYRLGRLGVFAHPALSREFPDEPKANYALMDLIAALTWVRRNVAAFGGDPANVTLFGQSSGGHAINLLMTSPMAVGLFHKAIVQSGGGRDPMTRLAEPGSGGLPSAETQGRAFAASLGCGGDDLAALRAVAAEDIIGAGDPDDPAIGGGPVIDGRLIVMEPMEAFARGLEAKVPYVIGCNSLEIAPGGADADAFAARFKRLGPTGVDEVWQAYGGAEAFERFVAADMVFCEPARTLARLHAANGQPAYLYRFGYVPPSLRSASRGAPHGAERTYVFGTLKTSARPPAPEDEALSRIIGGFWLNFARSGDPNGPGLPDWPACTAAGDLLMAFTDGGPAADLVPRQAALDAIAEPQRRSN
jgi:para-nitrobenzyl esterase